MKEQREDKVIKEILGVENAISPSDIFAKQFGKASFGGYNKKDVDDFLETIADTLEELIVQVRMLKEKNEDLRKQLDEFKEVEHALRGALVSTQNMGDSMLESAKREAEAILGEAKLKRAQAQIEAAKVPATLSRDIHLLEQQRARLRVEMMAILETHKRLLDSLIPQEAAQAITGFLDVGGGDRRTAPAAHEHVVEPDVQPISAFEGSVDIDNEDAAAVSDFGQAGGDSPEVDGS
ncbi:MAG: hypothetical protein AMXMBFR84_43440 [Candidatus Hydrogenedentota bacterium]